MGDKVLVVDNEKAMRDMLSEFLTGEGYEVILASSGEEALELADIEKPKLILLDLAMPGLGGMLACKKIKTQKSTQLIPIIVLSAFKEGRKQAVEAGADEFIQKPIQLTELQVRVRSMLRIANLTHELESARDP